MIIAIILFKKNCSSFRNNFKINSINRIETLVVKFVKLLSQHITMIGSAFRVTVGEI